jgi:hypothetical protein
MANIVQYITYKGEKWPVRISYYAIKKFQEETKKDISELDKDIAFLEILLWYGLIAGHIAETKPMTLKREEMEFILDESMNEFNEAILSFFPLQTDSENKKK